MAGAGNNRFGLTCAQVRQFMMEQNRQVRMGDLVGSSSSFQRPLQLTPAPVPVPVAKGPAGAWDVGSSSSFQRPLQLTPAPVPVPVATGPAGAWDVGSSSSFQRPLQLTPSSVPVPVATGPAGAWDTGATTLSLFPAGTGKEIIRPEETQATLTIFYQGQVVTFHDFPADRAKDLMQMATSVTGKAPEMGFFQMAGSVAGKAPEKGFLQLQMAGSVAGKAPEKGFLQMAGSVAGKAPEKGFLQTASSVAGKAPEKGVTTAVPETVEVSDEPSAAGAGMQPIARKLTLQRFLRKRKHRTAGTDDADHSEDAWPWKKIDSAGAGSNPAEAEDVPDDASWLRL